MNKKFFRVEEVSLGGSLLVFASAIVGIFLAVPLGKLVMYLVKLAA